MISLLSAMERMKSISMKSRPFVNGLPRQDSNAKSIYCKFAQLEMEHLGYIIKMEWIKPNPKKVQAILDIQLPTTKTELHHFISMA